MFRCLIMLLVALNVTPALARTLTVEGVVSPAWVERAGKREPLTVGLQLTDKDKIITGERARVMLRMSEGSAVKLGENATLALDNLAQKTQAGKAPVVSASLDVVKGAFRFTTGVFGKPRAERDINVKIATITAGIRGTDLWGRSTTTEDLLCLLEGRIAVRHGQQSFVMNEALQLFVVPRNDKPKPITRAPQQQIDEWSLETEITEGLGAVRAGGAWRLEVMRSADQSAARALAGRLQDAGYPALVAAVETAQGGTQYAVRVPGIATAKDSDALLSRLGTLLADPSRQP